MKNSMNVKHIGSIKSMQHVKTRPGDERISARLHHAAVNRSRLFKEREVMLAKLAEIERQLKYADEQMLSTFRGMKEQLPHRRKKGNSSKKGSSGESSRRTSSMDLEF